MKPWIVFAFALAVAAAPVAGGTQAEGARHPVEPGQRRVVRQALRPVHLNRTVDDRADHVGHLDLDLRDLLPRVLLAGGVDLPRGVEHRQPPTANRLPQLTCSSSGLRGRA